MTDFVAGATLTAAQLDTAFNTFTIRDVSTTTATLGAADAGGMVNVNNNSGGTVTIPLNSTWAAETGTHVVVFNGGTAGTWTIAGTGGVTLNGTPLTVAAGKASSVFKTATNTWWCVPFSGGRAEAVVSGTTGSPTTTSITGYTVYEWSANGTFTLASDGLVEYLVQGGGGGSTGNYGGGGGNTRYGIAYLTAGAYTVTVGAGGTSAPTAGGTSEIVGVANCLGGIQGGATVYQKAPRGLGGDLFQGGGGSLTDGSGGTGGSGVTSSITGSALEYGAGGDYPGPVAGARGGGASGSAAGGAGTVIIRVAV